MSAVRVGLLGAGGIARAHAYALAALSSFYEGAPAIARVAVTSPSSASRAEFAQRHGFERSVEPEAFWELRDLDSVFLLGPNDTHTPQLERALAMPGVRRIYVEKPLCASAAEEKRIEAILGAGPGGPKIQIGFQFLQMSSVRRALVLLRARGIGEPVHFQARYLHGEYLEAEYRQRRRSRLVPAPAGGAMADLGCHVFSLLAAFLGGSLDVVAARASGSYPDVPPGCDLCTTTLVRHRESGAVGAVTASRISAGAGDLLELELHATGGALRLSTRHPDLLELHEGGQWRSFETGSDYGSGSRLTSPHVASGWLRSLVHAQHLFFGGSDPDALIPDLAHGLAVQRLVRATAERLAEAEPDAAPGGAPIPAPDGTRAPR